MQKGLLRLWHLSREEASHGGPPEGWVGGSIPEGAGARARGQEGVCLSEDAGRYQCS